MNKFKGVPGGDPAMRKANFKKKVTVSFICSTCGLKKFDKITEGKTRKDNPCVECQAEISRKKHKEFEQRMRDEQRKRERLMMKKPIRTEEEERELLEKFAHSERHKCDHCEREFIVDNNGNLYPFSNDPIYRPGFINTVAYTEDPFDKEIYDKSVMSWFCRVCYKNTADDI